MTFREKLLYHEVHPAKIIIDVTTALAAAVLLWQQHLLRAAAVGLAPPLIASLLVIQFANLEKMKHSPLGRYIGRNMTPALEVARLAGVFIFWGAAWYRSVFYCIVGLLVIAFAWVRGALQGVRTNRRRAMNCYTHGNRPAVGICAICQKAICHDCVGRDAPRLACRDCVERGSVLFGFEYKSSATIGTWPLVHVCTGMDPVTMRPKVAKGVIAIGNIAFGGLAMGGLAVGLISIGGLSIGLACAFGGAALGLGLSAGGFALGSVAIGGAAVGFKYAIGGAAFGPAVIDGRHCDEAARDLIIRWFGARSLPPSCPANPFRLIQ